MSKHLPPTCGAAFKEWAVVCAALATGRQTLILRKGGIQESAAEENRGLFQVKHAHFWLFPTGFHQAADSLVPDAGPLLQQALVAAPPAGSVRFTHWARVEGVFPLATEAQALSLAGEHIWSEATVRQRFAYRSPGLFCLVVRVFAVQPPHTIADEPYFAGCKSWVELPQALPLGTALPVLSDQTFEELRARVRKAIGG